MAAGVLTALLLDSTDHPWTEHYAGRQAETQIPVNSTCMTRINVNVHQIVIYLVPCRSIDENFSNFRHHHPSNLESTCSYQSLSRKAGDLLLTNKTANNPAAMHAKSRRRPPSFKDSFFPIHFETSSFGRLTPNAQILSLSYFIQCFVFISLYAATASTSLSSSSFSRHIPYSLIRSTSSSTASASGTLFRTTSFP